MKLKSDAKKIVTLDGLNLYYWVNWQKSMNKQFVFLHPGSSMNHSSLEKLEERLNEQGHPTIVFDPRGSGYSDSPTNPSAYSLENHSTDIKQILKQEGREKPVLAGHSYGFMPIVDYVVFSGNATAIVGICCSYKFSETTNPVACWLFNNVLRYFEFTGSAGMWLYHKIKGEIRNESPDQSSPQSEFDLWTSIVDIPFEKVKAHMVAGPKIHEWDIRMQLRELKTPMLLIYGNNDRMVYPRAGREIEQMTKGETYISILPGKHSIPIRRSEEVARVMMGYLKQTSS